VATVPRNTVPTEVKKRLKVVDMLPWRAAYCTIIIEKTRAWEGCPKILEVSMLDDEYIN